MNRRKMLSLLGFLRRFWRAPRADAKEKIRHDSGAR